MLRRGFEHLSSHPRARDALVAVLWCVVGLVLIRVGAVRIWRDLAVLQGDGFTFVVLLLLIAAVATQRSSHPMLALGAGAALAAIDLCFGGSIGVILVLTDLIYTAMKYGSDRAVRLLLAMLIACGVGVAALLFIWHREDLELQVLAVQWAVIILIAAVWGWNVRSERLRTRASMRAEHAQSTRRLRQRIAHDLHDRIANQIAVAGLHIEAAKLQVARDERLPAEAHHSLERAAQGTRQADEQLRRMITLLHTVEDLEEHSEASVDALIAEFLASPGIQLPGARRLLWLDGEPSLYVALRNQSPARAHVILRVLQELIANAAKHGQGDVTLRIGDEPAGLLTFEVTNEIAAQYGGASGNGIGITGCAVLLEGIGATLESCRSDTDGSGCWRATITVPRSEGDE